MEKRIGKIKSISFGLGGYQDAQIGVSVTLGSDTESWSVGDFRGYWAMNRDDHCKWSEEDRIEHLGGVCLWVRNLLNFAKKQRLDQLAGVPVEVTFDGNTLKDWRILTEAI